MTFTKDETGAVSWTPGESGIDELAARYNRKPEITIGGTGRRVGVQHDARLDNLNVERAAYLLGASSPEEVEAMARPKDRPYVRAALLNVSAMAEAISARTIDRETGAEGPATLEQRAQIIIERAGLNRVAAEDAKRWKAARDLAKVCPITGRIDDTTDHRGAPWLTDGPVLCSIDGLRAMWVVWLAAADPADVALAREYLIRGGFISEEPKAKAKR